MLYTTLQQLKNFQACSSGLDTLLDSLPPFYDDNAPISLEHILNSNGIHHAIWALRTQPKEVGIEFALMCTESVLYIFEKKYPDDNRPRKAVDMTRKWLENPNEDSAACILLAADDAVLAVKNDIYAANNIAYAASNVAYTTNNIAYAANNVAYAAMNLAYAASKYPYYFDKEFPYKEVDAILPPSSSLDNNVDAAVAYAAIANNVAKNKFKTEKNFSFCFKTKLFREFLQKN